MSKQYTVTLSDAEDKALHFVALSAQEWIDNAVHERCRLAMDQIIANEVQRKLDLGEPLGTNRNEIVLAAPIKSVAERNAEEEALLQAEVDRYNANTAS